jgi:hypothetical protein
MRAANRNKDAARGVRVVFAAAYAFFLRASTAAASCRPRMRRGAATGTHCTAGFVDILHGRRQLRIHTAKTCVMHVCQGRRSMGAREAGTCKMALQATAKGSHERGRWPRMGGSAAQQRAARCGKQATHGLNDNEPCSPPPQARGAARSRLARGTAQPRVEEGMEHLRGGRRSHSCSLVSEACAGAAAGAAAGPRAGQAAAAALAEPPGGRALARVSGGCSRESRRERKSTTLLRLKCNLDGGQGATSLFWQVAALYKPLPKARIHRGWAGGPRHALRE